MSTTETVVHARAGSYQLFTGQSQRECACGRAFIHPDGAETQRQRDEHIADANADVHALTAWGSDGGR